MALYSCNLSSIGKTTHQSGTAGAHIRYIARADAKPEILAEDMPDDPREARTFLDQQERDMRKNGRVIDKIRLALPHELDEAQRARLVQDFMADLQGNKRVPWFAAIHQIGKDAHNPHAHIAVHDRDIATGKRVLRLSDSARDRLKSGLPGPKAVEWIRQRWEEVGNRALARAGINARIDRRTLDAQGIDRLPTIHEGPRAQHINDNVKRPVSKPVMNGAGRVIDYPAIDKGRTRREFNAQIIDLNLERAARSKNPVTAAWAAFEKDQLAKDHALESQIAEDCRLRTAEHRTTSAKYTAQRKRAGAEFKLKTRQGMKQVRDQFQPRRDAIRAFQNEQRQALRKEQKSFMARIARRLSRTVRNKHLAARTRQIETHRAQRKLLSQTYAQAKQQARAGLTTRYSEEIERIEAQRSTHLGVLQEKHGQAENFVEILRQQREADREQTRQITERKIQAWKGMKRGQTGQEDKPAPSHLEKGWTAKGERTPEDRAAAAKKRM
ncbi:MAG: MobA/MobL family protein, partial [Nitrospinales bacterium]